MRWQSGKHGRHQLLKELGADLTYEEWEVLELYYGLGGENPMNQELVGRKIGKSQPSVSIVFRRAKGKVDRAILKRTMDQAALRAIEEYLPSMYLGLQHLADTLRVSMETVAKRAAELAKEEQVA
jgi:predicted DNA-binding protein (UPF0251 family)